MTAQKLLTNIAFYALVVVIVVFSVFPFYYAIITSFATGTELFKVNYWPKAFDWGNYESVLGGRNFVRSIWNSVFIATTTVVFALFLAVTASYALARVRFRGRGLLLMMILAVSMFPQIAVLAGLFELVRFLGIFNTPWAMIMSYVIFTLPFTVWVLTTFMRDLPVEIEEAAIVDGATPWVIITKVFLPLLWPALVTTGLLAFIGGHLDPVFTASGRALVDGIEITRLPPEERHAGILFQDPLLFPHMSVAGNLIFALPESLKGRSERRAQAEAALEGVGLDGMGTRDPATLSGGQKARVALARVLLSEPRMLLLDEPFSKLDMDLRQQMRMLVFDKAHERGLPVLLVTHDEADAEAAGGETVRIGE